MSIATFVKEAVTFTTGGESSLVRFWRWWTQELRDAAPSSLRKMFVDERPVLRVRVDEGHAGIDLCDSSGTSRIADIILAENSGELTDEVRAIIASASSEAGPAIVIVDDALILRRRVELPLDAQENLDAVVGFELDRFVPFSSGDIYYDFQVAKKDTASRVLETDLIVVRRSDVDPALDLITAAGLEVSAVTLSDDPSASGSSRPSTNLLPQELRKERRSDSMRLPGILAVASLLLLTASIWLPFWHLSRVGGVLEDDLAALRTEAQAAAEIRDQIQSVVTKSGFIATERASRPLVIAVLDEVTNAIPDNTWVGRVELNGNTLRLHGESEGASSLISLVEGAGMLGNARFGAPVTKNNRTNLDRFVLEAEIRMDEEEDE